MDYCFYENSDEPTCPKCGGYNACLADSIAAYEWRRAQSRQLRRQNPDTRETPDFRKCRDCGAQSVCVDKKSALLNP